MPKGKTTVDAAKISGGDVVHQPDSRQEQAAESVASDHVDILDGGNNLVRTYSLADHGETFANLADEFLSHHPGYRKH